MVTEFEFRLHPVGPIVHYGMLFFGQENGAEVLRSAREVIPALPREVNVVIACLNAPPAPFVPPEHHFKLGYALVAVGFGTAEQHAEALEQLRAAAPPLFELRSPMPYVAVQQLLDEPNAWGTYHYEKGTYLEELSEPERVWVRKFWDALQPHTINIGSYVNGLADADEARLRASYGDKYDRLVELKRKYDPTNVFHRNQNIRP